MNNIFAMKPTFGDTRIYRQITFDRAGFDALQNMKRSLNEFWDVQLTNAEVIRLLILTHPSVNPELHPAQP